MAAQASQAELNKFVKVVDEFKAKFAKLIDPATRAQVYASKNGNMISDYETAVVRGRALNNTIISLVGVWDAFKRGYAKVTDQTSMVIGDAIDEIRSWFGYKPMGEYNFIDEYGNRPIVGGQKPYNVDGDLYGMSYSGGLGLGALGAAPLAAIPAAVAVAAVISAALILNSLMDKIFVSIQANAIQKENPNISRGAALEQAERGLPSLLPGGVSLPMIAAGALALYFILGQKK